MRTRAREPKIQDMPGEPDPVADPVAVLTQREREVAVAIGQGTSTAEIGELLEISVRTVESHLWHAYRKLGVRNRVELVRWLLRHDLLDAMSD